MKLGVNVHRNLFIYPLKRRFFVILLLVGLAAGAATATVPSSGTAVVVSSEIPSLLVSSAPHSTASTRPVRALHVTAWKAGSLKYREHMKELFQTTVINAVVIDIKEFQGEVYVPGVKPAERIGAYVPAMPDIASWLADLKSRGVYTVARQVVFKDNIMPRKVRTLAVRNPFGELWFDRTKSTWLDPYNPEAWRYNLLIALRASELGFDEIQFDYIRFPTDGNLRQTRYSQPHKEQAATEALVSFLRQARQLLSPRRTKISIDIFGLTTTDDTGMGIGQHLGPMAAQVDFVCPMVYPSHYARGEYGIPNPNDEPYKTVTISLKAALDALGPDNGQKLRPYLQDFSLKGRGIHYGKEQVRAQIQAAADLGVGSWTLWNARCSYTLGAIRVADEKPSAK
jgi:hypothetical protein